MRFPLVCLTACLVWTQEIRFAPAPTNLRFVLDQSPTPEKHMVETMAGGIAAFDYNRDGRIDLFFTNGAALPAARKDAPRFHNRLYRNDGDWKFTDVTAEAGLAGVGYATGAAAGDFDNDGQIDLFVAGLYRNTLYRNLGNGRFADVTAASAIKSNEWSVAAGWFDYDGDGLLDLWVTNYGRIDLAAPRFCGDAGRKLRIYCHPKYYAPRPNQLYRNLGNGRFEDATVSSGVSAYAGRGMSIAFADYDADGRVDVFVANDNLPNFLFRNLGGGKFQETALLAGVALLDSGKAVASMGTDFRDVDNDGRPDLIVTALNGETFPFFRYQAGGFVDATQRSQLAKLTNGYSGWGVSLVDFDNDGRKDLFTANSHVNDQVELFEKATYRQANTVFRNEGDARFALVPGSGLEASAQAHRGAVCADFDGDGRMDVVVSALGAPAELWRNVTEPAGQWLGVLLEGKLGNRDAIGAQVRVGGQHQTVSTSVSYASSVHAPVHFGLGAKREVAVEITWPSGQRQTIKGVTANQVLRVVEGPPK